MKVRFALVGEGSSDTYLVDHIKTLLVICGADEASGTAPNLGLLKSVGKSVDNKIKAIMELEPEIDVLFVHRDADGDGLDVRVNEISSAADAVSCQFHVIPIVPVRELEAWLLVDEDAIRRASGNPNGSVPLNLPSCSRVERVSDPKNLLFDKILLASELSGRRRDKFKKELSKCRKNLIEDLDPLGLVSSIPSHHKLRSDVAQYISPP